MLRSLLLLALLWVPLGCGPFVMFPGGALSGDVTALPASWAFTDAVDTVQLETNPDDPYSVNVWGVAAGDTFYIAGDRDNQWAQNIRANPNVRLRVDGRIYELTARETRDDADLDAFMAAVKRKYDYEPDTEQRGRASLFRLSPR